MPFFSFMTGASTYRCQANSRQEVLDIARASLNPTPDMMAIIESTLYEEGEAAVFVGHGPAERDGEDTESFENDFEREDPTFAGA